MRRRTFVAGSLSAAGALALRWPLATLAPPGLQLYTVRSLMKQDVARTLDQVAAIGYREVETAGYFNLPPREFRRLLDASGLRAVSAHLPLEHLADRWPAALDDAEAIGHQYIIVPWVGPAMRQSLDTWRTVAAQLNQAGAASRARGITVGYHNHEFEFAPIDGVRPYDILLRETDPARVVMELDLFWIRKGGQDPLRYFREWPGRFPLVHAKDMTTDGAMVDVGQGAIDWRAIAARRQEAGLTHWFVEHDDPADPIASIRGSFQFLRSLDGA
jgi:sugar phosphate isomerase/epimerase